MTGPPSTVEFRTFCRLGGSLSFGKSLFSLNWISATQVQSRPKGRNSTVVMPPDDRLDGAAEVLVLGLVRRAALRNQRCQLSPLRIGQNAITSFICHGPNIGTDIRS